MGKKLQNAIQLQLFWKTSFKQDLNVAQNQPWIDKLTIFLVPCLITKLINILSISAFQIFFQFQVPCYLLL